MSDITDSTKIRVGVEICTSALRAASIGQDGKLAETRTVPLDGSGETLPQLIALIGELENELGDFEKIGIAVPGLVDIKSGHVEFRPISRNIRMSIWSERFTRQTAFPPLSKMMQTRPPMENLSSVPPRAQQLFLCDVGRGCRRGVYFWR